MPLFEVTLSDGSTSIMQAHNKTQLRAALQNVKLTRIEQKKRCRGVNCREVATVQSTFCATCWTKILTEFREVWTDTPMSEQELQDTVMSYFDRG